METPMTPDAACCDDYRLSRRTLLRSAGAAAAAGAVTSVFGGAVVQTVYGATPGQGNVLLLLSLRGGVDGMSMVVPYAEKSYYAARPSIAVQASRLIATDGTFGLHPAFAPLEQMWTSRRFAAIQAVGLPVANRSHFEAMELIEDADPTSDERVGWVNRMIAGFGSTDPFEGVHLSGPQTPTALYGPEPTLATSDLADLDLPYAWDSGLRTRLRSAFGSLYAGRDDLAGDGGSLALAVADRARRSAVTVKPQGGASYSGDDLGKALAQAAASVRSGLGVRALSIDYGSWDHHEGLAGRMSVMVANLARNLAAFFDDLGDLGDRVTVVTMSEFGRRLQQNGSAGLDHGHGNCVLVLGGGVRGGQYYGTWPQLASGDLLDADLAVTTDFRAVLAEILDRRFPEVSLASVFPGAGYSRASALGFVA
ncbi:DUF1501 domain-containing protein [Solicola sp. PLA-1-18]|uniref:DUF1501 domain-containing protein n=1 Tax=Solicola sp. PLA-1-18 TaxID=3380532 RepID=UPI003B786618